MAFTLPLPAPWARQHWKLKIRDRERLEPPHATLLHRTRAWRWNLRSGGFMDADPPPRDVPVEIVEFKRPLTQSSTISIPKRDDVRSNEAERMTRASAVHYADCDFNAG
jgi:hypothetical protein